MTLSAPPPTALQLAIDPTPNPALAAALPELFAALTGYDDNTDLPTIRVTGTGSSIGLGQQTPGVFLPDAQTPSGRFAARLQQALTPGNVTITHTNRSVGGAALDSFDDQYVLAAGDAPTVLWTTWGFNDGRSLNYNARQTYAQVETLLQTTCQQAITDGRDVVIATTPHPHPVNATWTTGEAITYPAAGVMIPDGTVAQSVVARDVLGDGAPLPVSYRHLRVNQVLRKVAGELGCGLVDAEHHWFLALRDEGPDVLFADTDYHLNLLGHQLTYWAAIDAFLGLRA